MVSNLDEDIVPENVLFRNEAVNEMEILSSQIAGRFGGGLYSSLIACIC